MCGENVKIFLSDYTVTEIASTLFDMNNNIIHSFDTSMNFTSPSYNPEMAIRIDKNLIKYVNSVSFTKIRAYTTQSINPNKN